MVNNELLAYARSQIAKGMTREQIKDALVSKGGWSLSDVEEIFSQLPPAPFVPSSTVNPIVQSTIPNQNPGMNISSVAIAQTTSKMGILAKSLIALVAVVALGGGAYGYAYFQGLIPVAKEKVFTKAVSGISDPKNSKSFEYSTSLDIELIGQSAGIVPVPGVGTKYNILIEGQTDASDANNPKSDIKINASSGDQKFSGELRFINPNIYGVATNVPNLGFFDASQFKDKWYRISLDDIENAMKDNGADTSMISKIRSSLLNKSAFDGVKDLLSYNIVSLGDKLPSEAIDGVNTYHYSFSINFDNLKKYLSDKSTQNEFNIVDSAYSDIQNAVSSVKSAEIWVGQKDFLPRKVSISADYKRGPFESKIILVSKLGKFGIPSDLKAPTESTDLVPLFLASLQEARRKGTDARIKSLLSNTRPLAEIYYDSHKSYKNVCESIKSEQAKDPSVQGAYCKDSVSAYASYMKVSDGKYFCADSTSFVGEISKPITGTKCR